jgi:hypothetical protein
MEHLLTPHLLAFSIYSPFHIAETSLALTGFFCLADGCSTTLGFISRVLHKFAMSKYFLACFIATPSGAVPGSDSTAGPASIWYGTSRTDDDDEEHLRQFATLLIEAGDSECYLRVGFSFANSMQNCPSMI